MSVCLGQAEQPRELRAIGIAAGLELGVIAVGATTDLFPHDLADRGIRPVAGHQPLDRETPVPVAPPAADVDHRHIPCGDLAEHDYVLGHQALLQPMALNGTLWPLATD